MTVRASTKRSHSLGCRGDFRLAFGSCTGQPGLTMWPRNHGKGQLVFGQVQRGGRFMASPIQTPGGSCSRRRG